MQISKDAYMSVESLLRLRMHSVDTPCSAVNLAALLDESVSYTEYLMTRLNKAALVGVKEGCDGGYHLGKAASQITIAEIFKTMDQVDNNFEVKPDAGTEEKGHTISDSSSLSEKVKSYILMNLDSVTLDDMAQDTVSINPYSTTQDISANRFSSTSSWYH